MKSNTLNKAQIIESRLQEAFSPIFLKVIDESDQHRGHAGHQGGGRHFAIMMSSASLQNMPRVAAHRKIYALFADMIPDQIHALRIELT